MLIAWMKSTAKSQVFAFHKILKPINVKYKQTFIKHSLIFFFLNISVQQLTKDFGDLLYICRNDGWRWKTKPAFPFSLLQLLLHICPVIIYFTYDHTFHRNVVLFLSVCFWYWQRASIYFYDIPTHLNGAFNPFNFLICIQFLICIHH